MKKAHDQVCLQVNPRASSRFLSSLRVSKRIGRLCRSARLCPSLTAARVSFDAETLELVWTPGYDQAGSYSGRVIATQRRGRLQLRPCGRLDANFFGTDDSSEKNNNFVQHELRVPFVS